MNLTFLAHFLNFFKRSFSITILQIKKNCIIEQNSILRNNTNIFPERIKLQVLQILTINKNSSFFWVIHSKQQTKKCGFTKSTLTHDSIGCSGLYIQIEVLKQKFLFKFCGLISIAVCNWNVMFESEFFKGDLTFFIFEVGCVFFFFNNWFLFKHEE